MVIFLEAMIITFLCGVGISLLNRKTVNDTKKKTVNLNAISNKLDSIRRDMSNSWLLHLIQKISNKDFEFLISETKIYLDKSKILIEEFTQIDSHEIKIKKDEFAGTLERMNIVNEIITEVFLMHRDFKNPQFIKTLKNTTKIVSEMSNEVNTVISAFSKNKFSKVDKLTNNFYGKETLTEVVNDSPQVKTNTELDLLLNSALENIEIEYVENPVKRKKNT